MNLIKILNPENASEEEIAKYKVRTAVRAVVYDTDGNVAILNVSKKNYYKLPGGGIEKKEDNHTALKRECREELGCNIEIYGEVGRIIEYRKIFQPKQISLCYLARVAGEKGQPSFTQEETSNGFQTEWLPLKQILRIMAARPHLSDKEGRLYIVPRDMAFLKAFIANQIT